MLKLFVSLNSFVTQTLHRDDRGVTSVEYALMAALIAVAIIVAVTGLGTALSTEFNNIAKAI